MELVRGIGSTRAKQIIIAGIIAIAEALHITVLAEGVETELEARVLSQAGIPIQQGYYFAKLGVEALPAVSHLAGGARALAA